MNTETHDPTAESQVVGVSDSPVADPTPWRRLDIRVIWVDLVRLLLSLVPYAVATWALGVEPDSGTLWPIIGFAVFGILSSVGDAIRWAFTRYRVTSEYVERRTGVFVRKYRSVRRDRIRSVDTSAKLLQRWARLRVVEIGAGQQTAASESALSLDAVSKAEAALLHLELIGSVPRPAQEGADRESVDADGEVLSRMRPRWVVYNMFSIWAYIMAAGLFWGAISMGSAFGLDIGGWVVGLYDWETLGWGWTTALALVVIGLLGAIGMGINYFTEYWNFELARVRGEDGTQLRTRRGLFRTREVNREDRRMRGVRISEPVLWRWMGMADTNVITTGLNVWGMSQPTAILPRGPIEVARRVASKVLAVDPSPFEAPLRRHPRRALRRRLVWATALCGAITLVTWWLISTGVLAAWTILIGPACLPMAWLGGIVSYRALGHAIAGEYLVFRSGLMSRGTVALRRDSVSTIAVSQSIFQRRLGLKTVHAMTAAGWGAYGAPDVAADEAVALACEAAPGVLDDFLVAPR